ncbi:MAG: dihydropteroate synthase [Candidatus Omnitrophica bacterium]|nr:dihydropteroate synthase [Candidatus Omnitrophota bacterium]
MGILNVTPDSFSDGGRYARLDAAVRRAEAMVEEGAALIDIGGESTRPGAAPVTEAEELARVLPVIRRVAKRLSVPISIDTSKAEVARQAVDAGAGLVNDVTALRGDPAMAAVVANARVPVILMHMRGTPRTMQRHPRYRNVTEDVRRFLLEASRRAIAAGIPASRILIDPGLGFGKTVAHNLQLLQHLDVLADLGMPVVIGPSRKAFLGRVLGAEVNDRLPGTLACVAAAAARGGRIVRVHDVKPAVDFLRMLSAIGAA